MPIDNLVSAIPCVAYDQRIQSAVLWMAVPMVVIDVYEHAFYIDYQNRKTEYVDKFVDHIDWSEVGNHYRAM